jgi:hypothetical protein
VKLPLVDIFRSGTIRELTALVIKAEWDNENIDAASEGEVVIL